MSSKFCPHRTHGTTFGLECWVGQNSRKKIYYV